MPAKKDKVAIVTGASQGIGAATAALLDKKGFSVVMVSRSPKKMGNSTLSISADVTKPKDVKNVIQETLSQFGQLDVLVNCAGVLSSGNLEATPDEEIANVIQTNLLGTILFCKYALLVMKKQKNGHIVNLSSIAGTKAQEGMAVYSASKFGVMGFTDALNLEAKKFGIRVTSIRPGTVDTDFWGKGEKPKGLLSAEDVSRSIVFAIEEPPHSVIRDIFIHPLG